MSWTCNRSSMLVSWKTVSDVHFDVIVSRYSRLGCSSTINWRETHCHNDLMSLFIANQFFMLVVCRNTATSELKDRRYTAAKRVQTPTSENGADCCEWVDLWTPECVCVFVWLWVCPPVWPTACLYSWWVSAPFAQVGLLFNIGCERAKKKEGSLFFSPLFFTLV